MKIFKAALLLTLLSIPAFAGSIKTGEDLISAMQKKYESKWYKTLTFKQKTITYKDDGTTHEEIWYEALSVPGKLRIDFDPIEKGNGLIFADEKLSSFKDGKLTGSSPFVHPLLVLGFDVYHQPADKTVSQLKGMKIDMSVIHQTEWQGKKAYVVGAEKGDLKKPQFWVDKKKLLFVRMFDLVGKERNRVSETQFNNYVKIESGGWVAAGVEFFLDGKRVTSEEYSDIKTGMALGADLFDPDKWMSIDRNYFKKG